MPDLSKSWGCSYQPEKDDPTLSSGEIGAKAGLEVLIKALYQCENKNEVPLPVGPYMEGRTIQHQGRDGLSCLWKNIN